MIEESINPPLADRSRAQLYPQMWERASAQVAPGRSVNELFVSRVVTSHAAMALFKTRLGPGTGEEVQAVLDQRDDLLPEDRVWLSVLRFGLEEREAPSEDPAPLDEFLNRIGEDRRGLYVPTGPLSSEEAWQAIVKTLTGYALAALDKSREKERTDVR